VPRSDVAGFLHDFLNVPSEFNHGVTMNSYWMETSFGQYGVDLDAFGVYEMPKPHWDYFMDDFQAGLNRSLCPSQAYAVGDQEDVSTFAVTTSEFFSVGQVISISGPDPEIVGIPDGTHSELNGTYDIDDGDLLQTCQQNFRTDALAAWRAEQGPDVDDEYDNIFYVSSGQDESGSWQEFGEMIFEETTDCDGYNVPYCGVVSDAFGNPNPNLPNWAGSRYIPWSSWASASTIWPNASGNTSIEGESSGMAVYAHELTHNLGIGDNYKIPPVR
jgi:hypothetical protein